jgi:hypothetical protein
LFVHDAFIHFPPETIALYDYERVEEISDKIHVIEWGPELQDD